MLLKWLPENISTFGGDVDFVIHLIFYVVGAWFLLAFGLLLAFCVLYRRRGEDRPPYVPGRSFRTLSFVLVPTFLVLCFDMAIDVASQRTWDKVKRTLPEADLTVIIQGEQFAWRFIYPGPDGKLGTGDEFETLNHMYVPKDRVVRFELVAKEVIHSFFVPNLRLKQDAVPGRTIPGWFEATKTGMYQIACAELCGLGHTNMRGWMHVMEPHEYQDWARQQAAEAAEGEE